jgi:hypothetical protein
MTDERPATDKQRAYCESIAKILDLELPEPLTFESASDFIATWKDDLP